MIRRKTTMSAVPFAGFAAAALAMVGAMFGVAMARLIWADDLKHAQRIDEIRSRTEVHLKDHIKALENQIKLLNNK